MTAKQAAANAADCARRAAASIATANGAANAADFLRAIHAADSALETAHAAREDALERAQDEGDWAAVREAGDAMRAARRGLMRALARPPKGAGTAL